MNFNRVFALTSRYFINFKHSYDRIGDVFYWPLMDILIWGLTGLYIAQLQGNNQLIIQIILTGVIFWYVVWRAQYEITVNLLVEMWDRNLINIFAAPVRVTEWMASFILVGFIKMLINVGFAALLCFLIYKFSIFVYGFYIIPAMISLLLTGWAVGFFIAGFLIRFGQKIQTLAWVGVVIIAPFSALYYPVAVLPSWAQNVSAFVPPSYVFESLRQVLQTGTFPIEKIGISIVLNLVYLLFGIWFFIMMFNKSRKLGLGRLI
jgi:ABC-2 type transport system permease protein